MDAGQSEKNGAIFAIASFLFFTMVYKAIFHILMPY